MVESRSLKYIISRIENHRIPAEFSQQIDNLLTKIVKKKNVLVKPNVVFPANPQVCTDPLFLLQTCQMLLRLGARDISVGDTIPELSKSLSNVSSMTDAYSKLGYYDALKGLEEHVHLVDLWEELPHEYVQINRNFSVRVISEPDIIISLSLPKIHSEAIFSGCAKNLMGIVHPDDIIKFHSYFPTHAESRYRDILGMTEVEREAFKGLVEKLGLQTFEEVNPLFLGMTLTKNTYDKYVNLLSEGSWFDILRDFASSKVLSTYLDELKKLKLEQSHFLQIKINEFLKYILSNRTCFGLLDATFLIAYDQHAGKPFSVGFVIGSLNPVVTDRIALRLMKISSSQLFYLDDCHGCISYEKLPSSNIDFESICYPITTDTK
ncbi:MAG: DUF362 domain-containing protein [Nitrospirota bacterium]